MDQNKNNQPEDLDFSDSLIVLEDEDGTKEEFELVDQIDYNDHDYVVLIPLSNEDEEVEDVVICEVVPGPDEETDYYIGVENDDILEAVFGIFKQRAADDFNFVD
jgi:uncharacterized protein YrzB (UPF0473 family)